ncbi:MAG: sigma 54-interacting transcriptional regulator, partial [Myxococcota bacterium]
LADAAVERAPAHAAPARRGQAAALFVTAAPEATRRWLRQAAGWEAELAAARLAVAAGDDAPFLDSASPPAVWDRRLAWHLARLDRAEAQGDTSAAEAEGRELRELLDAAAASLPVAARARFRRLPRFERVLQRYAPAPASTPSVAGDDRWKQLASWAERLHRSERPERIVAHALEAALLLTGAERALFVVRDDSGALRVDAASPEIRGAAAFSRSVITHALAGEAALASVDALSDVRLEDAESVHQLAVRSVLAAPLREGRAALYLDDRLRAAAFDEADRALLESLAGLLGRALDAAERLRSERAAVFRLELLEADLRATVEAQREELVQLRGRVPEVVAESPKMRAALDLALRVAGSELSVLLRGESGSGKEVLARAIHSASARARAPFVAESCGALSDTLLESALFGHERGAFTGASEMRRGLFELAHGGTLFLDEVGEMSPALQAKLLRVLQERELRRVGGTELRAVDVRVVAATHRDLEALVADGRFREDLYYRLAVVTVALPPLRERSADLGPLVERLLARRGHGGTRVAPAVLAALARYDWPGNVRELDNELQRALVLAGDELRLEHLRPALTRGVPEGLSGDLDLKGQVRTLEARLLSEALVRTDGNQTQAAQLLGLSRYGLQKMMKRLGVAKDGSRVPA